MKKIYAFLLTLIMYSSYAQDGSLFTSFNPPSNAIGYYAMDSDGNYLVIKSNPVNLFFEGIAKISSGGIEDPSFILENFTSLNGLEGPQIIFIQSDGNILIGGTFTNYGTTGRKRLIRVSSTGVLDENFNPSIPDGFNFASIAEYKDKIFIGGYSSSTTIKPLYCLNKQFGNFDSPYMANLGTNATGWSEQIVAAVLAIKPLDNGDIIIGGSFNAINGNSRRKIAKINADGTLNNAVFSGLDNNTLYAIETQIIDGDIKVLIAGSITHNSGRKFLLRLNTDLVLDTSFNDPNLAFIDTNVENAIYSFKVQESNKIVIGGAFTHVGSTPRSRIARLNADGTLDECFDPGTGLDNPDPTTNTYQFLNKVSIDLNQNILILGTFQYYNGEQKNYVAKVIGNSPLTNNVVANPDSANIVSGSGNTTTIDILDNDTYYGSDAAITNVTVTPSVSNITVSGINFDASSGTITVASTTAPGVYTYEYKICSISGCGGCSATTTVTITVANTSQIVANDDNFTFDNCTAHTFNILTNDTLGGIFVNATTNPVTIDYVMANFGTFPPIQMNYVTGLVTVPAGTPPGTYYFTYKICAPNSTNCDTADAYIEVIGVDAVGDMGTAVAGTATTVVANVLVNDKYFTLDASTSLVTVSTVSSSHAGITLNGTAVLVNASVPAGNYTLVYKICDNTGSCPGGCDTATVYITVTPPSIMPGLRANNIVWLSGLQSVAPNTGKIIIAGGFTAYNNNSVPYITRLNTDLTFDSSFLCTGPTPASSFGFEFDVHPNDKIFITGPFTGYSGQATKGFAMLKSDGSYDTTFNIGGTGLNSTTGNPVGYSSERQSDGKIVIVGNFTHYNTTARAGIVRVSSAGGLDSSFNGGTVTFGGGTPYCVKIQPNGQILVSGYFSSYQGVTSRGIARMSSSGTVDSAFATETGAGFAGNISGDNNTIQLQLLTDGSGRIMAYGSFTSFKGQSRNNIVRIKSTGDIDSSFNPGSGFNGYVRSLVIEPTGNMIVGGDFTTYKGLGVKKLVRLFPDGTLDTSFYVGAGTQSPGNIFTMTRQPADGKIIIGGSFTQYNNVSAQNITRIAPATPLAEARGLTIWESEPEIDTNPVMKSGSISIYPNPSEGLYNLEFRGYDEQKFDITVHNALGQLVYQGTITSQDTNQIDLTRFESGSYYITLLSNTQTINKVVIKK